MLLVLSVTTLGHAEARWCSISGLGPSDAMPYPAIARAARVYGVVVGRIQFRPSGTVTGFDPVFGPPMLTKAVANQVKKWTITTKAAGQEPCQALAIFKFSLDKPECCQPAPSPAISTQNPQRSHEISRSSGILSLSIRGETVCLCDPGGVLGQSGRFPRIFLKLKQVLRWTRSR